MLTVFALNRVLHLRPRVGLARAHDIRRGLGFSLTIGASYLKNDADKTLLLTFANIRAWRGHFGPEQKNHLGVEVPGIYWHFVDIMWIVVFVTIYII